MLTDIDPEGVEARAVSKAAGLDRARVLEIGTGDGRLAYRYADRTALVVGLEPQPEELRSALALRPVHLARRVRFVRGSTVLLPFRSATFDTALFAWSL
jgi:ubiquinone/menaquinone biosynthesis C-methylase UbiE